MVVGAVVLPLTILAWSKHTQFVFEWQTLITGFVALAAAGIAFVAVQQQIASNENIARNRAIDRLMSARSVLPIVLANLMNYLDDVACVLNGLRDPQCASDLEAPRLPTEAIQILRELVESLPELAGKKCVWHFLAALQVQHSRVHSHFRSLEGTAPAGRARLVDLALDAMEMHIFASHFFAFARGETDHLTSPGMSESELASAARLLRLTVFLTSDDTANQLVQRTRHGLVSSIRIQ